jgi:hypothetical protein
MARFRFKTNDLIANKEKIALVKPENYTNETIGFFWE